MPAVCVTGHLTLAIFASYSASTQIRRLDRNPTFNANNQYFTTYFEMYALIVFFPLPGTTSAKTPCFVTKGTFIYFHRNI